MCEIGCNAGLRFSEPVPKFYTCGAEGFWRPTSNPNLPVVYPACSRKSSEQLLMLERYLKKILKCGGSIHLFLCAESKSAQRVFKVGMKFPTSVLCNEAGQGVLRQKVRTSINALNREWNFCSNSLKGNSLCPFIKL